MTDGIELRLWRWRYTDRFGKRRVTRYVLSEADAARLVEAEKIEYSLEVRRVGGGYTSDFLRGCGSIASA